MPLDVPEQREELELECLNCGWVGKESACRDEDDPAYRRCPWCGLRKHHFDDKIECT